MKYIPYVAAMTEPRLSEAELMPKKNWYPNQKKKERAILRESKANDRTSFPDQVCGVLNPIVYALNKGKAISPKSAEHKMLLELLNKANV